ncbi:MAG: hypothetical protein HC913_20565 [Microscillaceae bacterium]|nr:hypothetical protein [Microscillaceae bacterium]
MQSWDILTDLLAEMQGKPAAAQAALVEKFCGSDAALHAEIEALLELLPQADDFFENLEDQLQSLFWGAEEPLASRAGEELGPFVLEEEIGRGGMGRVYRARRNDGLYAQTVAIKILKRNWKAKKCTAAFAKKGRYWPRSGIHTFASCLMADSPRSENLI